MTRIVTCAPCGREIAGNRVPVADIAALEGKQLEYVLDGNGKGGYLLCPLCSTELFWRSDGDTLDVGIP